ncbi:Fatty acid cis/trans isomerase (CTI) [Ruegeria denitrificans]|uniref:Fatty acid cis/trans isomerase (CTI) n=1 Tax=Ruegeria denitrificans TaxID=1715692 RepID=A0A0P1I8Z3_9RHOB|nr:fatty acid cis/trans isomerase [Ruegeria denitrificans]CUJ98884.1 Fatty acid cis/trans isomerase (CTI) [Ruegeria denitrificans]
MRKGLLPLQAVMVMAVSITGVFTFEAWAQETATPVAQDQNWADVKTIMDRRCVVCHSCYDAPCQLKLTSPEGVLRGASKQAVYHTERLTDAQPTRLGIDAQTVPEWRALGFHTVTSDPEQADTPGLLERYLELGREKPMPENAPLPDALGLALDRPLVCPTSDEFDQFSRDHALAGMPYGTAPLADTEYQALMTWSRSGAPLLSVPIGIPAEVQDQISQWEAFLNSNDPRSQLMSRYLYEHLFLARLHFQGDAPRRFFQLVRSTTAPGEAVDIIASRRPFDDPGADAFYYRLQQSTETIVHKEHLVYSIGPDRMARYRQLFLDPEWTLAELPAYGDAEGGNPFSTFMKMPAKSRYQFLLDDALFFVRSFIRGPVCHGETAVDVIEDRFWVSFLDPDADLSIADPSFLKDGAAYLELPVSEADAGALGALPGFSHRNQVRYLEFRDARYKDAPIYQTGFDYGSIWDGDGTNPNALITVFRHFDNASAMTGFHGDIPETAWVLDFPIFERINYDLVAGYDVFGRVEHQLTTRLYMDELRMESEDTFLFFMPKDVRSQMHKSWYQGTLAEWHTYWHRRHVDGNFPTGITFETSSPKQEFLLTLLERGNGLWATNDPINRCTEGECSKDYSEIALRELADQTGDWVKYLPDLSVLVVENNGGTTELFTLVHDKAHFNVAFLFDEIARRNPEADEVTILPGLIGSYPNFYFHVGQNQLAGFNTALKSIRSQSDYLAAVAQYGVRRTSPDFWVLSDLIYEMFLEQKPIQAGVFDLNRYKDPKPNDDPT